MEVISCSRSQNVILFRPSFLEDQESIVGKLAKRNKFFIRSKEIVSFWTANIWSSADIYRLT